MWKVVFFSAAVTVKEKFHDSSLIQPNT